MNLYYQADIECERCGAKEQYRVVCSTTSPSTFGAEAAAAFQRKGWKTDKPLLCPDCSQASHRKTYKTGESQ